MMADRSSDPPTPAPGRSRIAWIDMARGVSVVAIVTLHASLWFRAPLIGEDDSWASAAWDLADDRLGTVRLPLLLLLSGWLASGRLLRPEGGPKTRIAVATNAWLYAVWLTVYLLVALVVTPYEIVDPPAHAGEVVARYLVPLITPLWFVWALAVYNAVFRAARRVPPSAVLGALFLTGWFLDLTHGNAAEPMWMRAIRLAIYFAAGVFARDTLRHVVERRHAGPVAFGIALAAAVVDRVTPAVLHHPLTVLASVAVAIAVLAALRALAGRDGVRVPLQWIGRRTVGVYVLHPPLVVLLTAACLPAREELAPVFGTPAGRALLPLVVTAIVVASALALQSLLHRCGLARVALDLPGPWRARLAGDHRRPGAPARRPSPADPAHDA